MTYIKPATRPDNYPDFKTPGHASSIAALMHNIEYGYNVNVSVHLVRISEIAKKKLAWNSMLTPTGIVCSLAACAHFLQRMSVQKQKKKR